MDDELWIKRDGTAIAVGDMTMDHLQNTLRMILRLRRLRKLTREADDLVIPEPTVGEIQDDLSAAARAYTERPDTHFNQIGGYWTSKC